MSEKVMSHVSKKKLNAKVIFVPGTCVFCGCSEDNEEKFGKLLSKDDITVHYFCMLFASGLCQNGDSEGQGIMGFLLKDILKEVRRAQRLRCVFCKKIGATIGCVVTRCRMVFHLPCGADNGVLTQFKGRFCSYCQNHRPRQSVPCSDRLAFHGTAKSICSICMCSVEARSSNSTLRAPCCKNSWFHKQCLQRHATCSGLHFFKCPLCNNREHFQDEMLNYGIYIPDQDAAWEQEPNAYQELLHRHSRCDSLRCKCTQGRDYNKEGSKWEVMLCDWCGSQGTHLSCENLKTPMDDWVCHQCQEFIGYIKTGKGKKTPQSMKKKKEADKDWLKNKLHAMKRPTVPSGRGKKRKRTESTTCGENPPKRAYKRRSSVAGTSSSPSLPSPSPGSSGTWSMPDSMPGPGTAHSQVRRAPSGASSVNGLALGVVGSSGGRPPVAADKKPRRLSRYLEQKREQDDADLAGLRENQGKYPPWLRKFLKQDIFTGKNLGSKFAEQFPASKTEDSVATTSTSEQNKLGPPDQKASTLRRSRSRTEDWLDIKKHHSLKNMPIWYKNLMSEDIFTGKNLGQKFANKYTDQKVQDIVKTVKQSDDKTTVDVGKEVSPSRDTDAVPLPDTESDLTLQEASLRATQEKVSTETSTESVEQDKNVINMCHGFETGKPTIEPGKLPGRSHVNVVPILDRMSTELEPVQPLPKTVVSELKVVQNTLKDGNEGNFSPKGSKYDMSNKIKAPLLKVVPSPAMTTPESYKIKSSPTIRDAMDRMEGIISQKLKSVSPIVSSPSLTKPQKNPLGIKTRPASVPKSHLGSSSPPLTTDAEGAVKVKLPATPTVAVSEVLSSVTPKHSRKGLVFPSPTVQDTGCGDNNLQGSPGTSHDSLSERKRQRTFQSSPLRSAVDLTNKPKWFCHLMREDIITGVNLGTKLASQFQEDGLPPAPGLLTSPVPGSLQPQQPCKTKKTLGWRVNSWTHEEMILGRQLRVEVRKMSSRRIRKAKRKLKKGNKRRHRGHGVVDLTRNSSETSKGDESSDNRLTYPQFVAKHFSSGDSRFTSQCDRIMLFQEYQGLKDGLCGEGRQAHKGSNISDVASSSQQEAELELILDSCDEEDCELSTKAILLGLSQLKPKNSHSDPASTSLARQTPPPSTISAEQIPSPSTISAEQTPPPSTISAEQIPPPRTISSGQTPPQCTISAEQISSPSTISAEETPSLSTVVPEQVPMSRTDQTPSTGTMLEEHSDHPGTSASIDTTVSPVPYQDTPDSDMDISFVPESVDDCYDANLTVTIDDDVDSIPDEVDLTVLDDTEDEENPARNNADPVARSVDHEGSDRKSGGGPSGGLVSGSVGSASCPIDLDNTAAPEGLTSTQDDDVDDDLVVISSVIPAKFTDTKENAKTCVVRPMKPVERTELAPVSGSSEMYRFASSIDADKDILTIVSDPDLDEQGDFIKLGSNIVVSGAAAAATRQYLSNSENQQPQTTRRSSKPGPRCTCRCLPQPSAVSSPFVASPGMFYGKSSATSWQESVGYDPSVPSSAPVSSVLSAPYRSDVSPTTTTPGYCLTSACGQPAAPLMPNLQQLTVSVPVPGWGSNGPGNAIAVSSTTVYKTVGSSAENMSYLPPARNQRYPRVPYPTCTCPFKH